MPWNRDPCVFLPRPSCPFCSSMCPRGWEYSCVLLSSTGASSGLAQRREVGVANLKGVVELGCPPREAIWDLGTFLW